MCNSYFPCTQAYVSFVRCLAQSERNCALRQRAARSAHAPRHCYRRCVPNQIGCVCSSVRAIKFLCCRRYANRRQHSARSKPGRFKSSASLRTRLSARPQRTEGSLQQMRACTKCCASSFNFAARAGCCCCCRSTRCLLLDSLLQAAATGYLNKSRLDQSLL